MECGGGFAERSAAESAAGFVKRGRRLGEPSFCCCPGRSRQSRPLRGFPPALGVCPAPIGCDHPHLCFPPALGVCLVSHFSLRRRLFERAAERKSSRSRLAFSPLSTHEKCAVNTAWAAGQKPLRIGIWSCRLGGGVGHATRLGSIDLRAACARPACREPHCTCGADRDQRGAGTSAGFPARGEGSTERAPGALRSRSPERAPGLRGGWIAFYRCGARGPRGSRFFRPNSCRMLPDPLRRRGE